MWMLSPSYIHPQINELTEVIVEGDKHSHFVVPPTSEWAKRVCAAGNVTQTVSNTTQPPHMGSFPKLNGARRNVFHFDR